MSNPAGKSLEYLYIYDYLDNSNLIDVGRETLLVGVGVTVVGFLAQGFWNILVALSKLAPAPPGNRERQPHRRNPSHGHTSRATTRNNKETQTDNNNLRVRNERKNAFRDQNLPDQLICTICVSNPREICLLPCGHFYLCRDCAKKIETKCPFCQQHILSKKPIFL